MRERVLQSVLVVSMRVIHRLREPIRRQKMTLARGPKKEVVVSGARNVWWLDLAGYDAEAWRWLAEGVDEYMDHDDKIAYLGKHLSVAYAPS